MSGEGRVAVVVGGASGIGEATARLMAGRGWRVAIAERDADAAARAAGPIGALALGLDVADRAAVEAASREIEVRAGRVHALVVAAAVFQPALPPAELPMEAWDEALRVNLTGTYLANRAFGTRMAETGAGGSIVNIASIMGLVGGGLYPNLAYHSTKGALVNFTRALAVEWAGRGVRVNAVAPTFVKTPLTARLLSDAQMKAAIEGMTPLGRLAEAEEIADAVLYLASDAAAMVTGHTLPVDGGWVAR